MNNLLMAVPKGAPASPDKRLQHYRKLMDQGRNHPNTQPLAEIIASWQTGEGALPDCLGLEPSAFEQLHRFHFGTATSRRVQSAESRLDPRLDDLRQDLLTLLLADARDDSEEVRWVAELLITACQGSRHLWEDLGVWSRASLSKLLFHNFPALAERNVRDMKWKKFLFKQLCETEGIYICRAPSCDECSEFDDCFGPE